MAPERVVEGGLDDRDATLHFRVGAGTLVCYIMMAVPNGCPQCVHRFFPVMTLDMFSPTSMPMEAWVTVDPTYPVVSVA